MVVMTRIVNLFSSAQYIAGFLKRNGSHKYPEIRISEIRDYCVEKLGVPYNYSR